VAGSDVEQVDGPADHCARGERPRHAPPEPEEQEEGEARDADGERAGRRRSGTSMRRGPNLRTSVSEKRVCTEKYTARSAITPTTAAVMPVRAAASRRSWRSRSTCGAPKKMNKKHGT
jgi:hypothetical protein